jgi:hypothetical protein
MTTERRRNRSDDPLVALHYQLTQTRREQDLDAIVVADPCGIVVAGAGAWAACEELAAYAPLFASGVPLAASLGGSSRMNEMRRQVEIEPVEVDGQTVLLCSRGGPRRKAALAGAAGGVARILTTAG